jgi:hypothetical protein
MTKHREIGTRLQLSGTSVNAGLITPSTESMEYTYPLASLEWREFSPSIPLCRISAKPSHGVDLAHNRLVDTFRATLDSKSPYRVAPCLVSAWHLQSTRASYNPLSTSELAERTEKLQHLDPRLSSRLRRLTSISEPIHVAGPVFPPKPAERGIGARNRRHVLDTDGISLPPRSRLSLSRLSQRQRRDPTARRLRPRILTP